MKKFALTFAAFLALIAVSGVASAKPIAWSIDQNLSFLSLKLTTLSGAVTGEAKATLSGNAAADLDGSGILSLLSGSALLSDEQLNLSLGFLGNVAAGLQSVAAGLPTGVVNPTGSTATTYTYDLGGTTLFLNGGVITYSGSGPVGALLGSGSFDFNTDPLSFPIPNGVAIATLTLGPGSPNNTPVTLDIPLNVSTIVTTDPIQIDAALNARIVLTGVRIPEPGTMVLMGLGLIGLVPVVRRKLARG